jgi:hypothetical protein
MEKLIEEYKEWNEAQGLNLGSADEHLFDDNLTLDQRVWLLNFSRRWETEEKSLSDVNGRVYLLAAEAKPGVVVELDGGFDCSIGDRQELQVDNKGDLYFMCKQGKHYITPQLSSSGTCYIGLYPA